MHSSWWIRSSGPAKTSFVEINHSLPTADSSRAVVNCWRKDVHQVGLSLPRKSVFRKYRLDMAIIVDWDVKSQKTNKQSLFSILSDVSINEIDLARIV